MTGKTHQVIGMTAGLASFLIATSPHYQPASLAGVLVVSCIGSLLPDIDQPGSRLWNALPFGHIGGELVNPFLAHRNLTHSFLGYGIVCYGMYRLLLLAPLYWGLGRHYVFIAFAIAYGSHILADMLTVEGVPLLFPNQHMFGIPPHPFQGLRIETGHWFENLLIFPLVNAGFIVVIVHYWSVIRTTLFLP
ncbi:MAG: metal-dependent hydrolase [bacterium]